MTANPQKSIIQFLHQAQKVLIVGGAQGSGDTIGALLALRKVLAPKDSLQMLSPKSIPDKYSFLPHIESIQSLLGEQGDFVISISTQKAEVERVKYSIQDDSVDILVTPKKGVFKPQDVSFHQNTDDFDAIIVINADRLEDLESLFENYTETFTTKPIINISASPTNEFYGRMNYVNPGASSACELVYEMIVSDTKLSEALDVTLATFLLTGIIDATDSFLEPNTTAHCLEIASKLQALGADQSDIIEHLYKMKSLETLKVWGRVLGNLQLDITHKIAWSAVTRADFEIAESSPEDIGNFGKDLLRHTENTDLALLLIEFPEETLGQIRTAQPAVNLTQLNKRFQNVGKLVASGLDFHLPKKSVAEVETDFLRILNQYQEERLGLPPNTEVNKKNLKPKEETDWSPTHAENTKPTNAEPRAPEKIPFEAPLQAHEASGETPSEPKVEPPKPPTMETQEAEVTIDPENENIPDWLKKSLPKG